MSLSETGGNMKDIKEARKELKRVGCSQAKGDALRFMYANLLAFEQGLSIEPNSVAWPISEFYRKLGNVPDDKIYDKMKKMRKDYENLRN